MILGLKITQFPHFSHNKNSPENMETLKLALLPTFYCPSSSKIFEKSNKI